MMDCWRLEEVPAGEPNINPGLGGLPDAGEKVGAELPLLPPEAFELRLFTLGLDESTPPPALLLLLLAGGVPIPESKLDEALPLPPIVDRDIFLE
jgi:hypothetical protein